MATRDFQSEGRAARRKLLGVPTETGEHDVASDSPGGQAGWAQQVSSTQLPDMQFAGSLQPPPFGIRVLVGAGVGVSVGVAIGVAAAAPKLGMTHNLGGAPGRCMSFVSLVGV